MADPTGLVSLGLEGAGGLVRVRKRWKERHKVIKQLSAAVDRADLSLRRAPDDDGRAALQERLLPLVQQAVALLDRFARQKRMLAMARSVVSDADVAAAQHLVDSFKDADAEAEARRRLIVAVASIRQDVRAAREEQLPPVVAECRKLAVASCLLSTSFFEWGKPA
ncbi:hypothetical protein AURDEDRAFT_113856 [Auricularia subglabra TFB-10046 SS5]|nr:hypothetical protein AURDEDRAFT_113856 [Auricularia subglabra TFB-10046 SS5]